MTVTHEFMTPIWVQTPLGEGRAILFIDYGIDHNPVFLVQLNCGRIKCFDSNETMGCENMTYGITRPQYPEEGNKIKWNPVITSASSTKKLRKRAA
jgi:hypothetical protein